MILSFPYYSLLFPTGEKNPSIFGDVTYVWINTQTKMQYDNKGCP